MAGRFQLRRSKAARERAQRNAEAGAASIATFVALVTALAERMDAMPSAGLDRDRDRRARVQVLRRAAEAGRRNLDARGGHGADGQDGRRHTGG